MWLAVVYVGGEGLMGEKEEMGLSGDSTILQGAVMYDAVVADGG